MDKLKALRLYVEAFHATATQLNSYKFGREWMDAGVEVDEAAAWASLGYQAREAKPLIDQGITAAMQAAAEGIEADMFGGPDELAAQRIDELIGDGLFIDPAQVRIIRDKA